MDEGRLCPTDITFTSLQIFEAGLQSAEEHQDFQPLAKLAGLLRSLLVMIALPFSSASC